jgi:hypothetical protein
MHSPRLLPGLCEPRAHGGNAAAVLPAHPEPYDLWLHDSYGSNAHALVRVRTCPATIIPGLPCYDCSRSCMPFLFAFKHCVHTLAHVYACPEGCKTTHTHTHTPSIGGSVHALLRLGSCTGHGWLMPTLCTILLLRLWSTSTAVAAVEPAPQGHDWEASEFWITLDLVLMMPGTMLGWCGRLRLRGRC